MTDTKKTPVVHLDEVQGFDNQPKRPDGSASTRFGSRMALVGEAAGARELGAIYMQVAPGKRAFPYHLHHANEEMFVILEGEGTYRFDGQDIPIRAGSLCTAPKGEGTAHQIVNTGAVPLKYLSISTRNDPDVVEYPDSGKYMAYALSGRTFPDTAIRALGRVADSLSYFDGEEM